MMPKLFRGRRKSAEPSQHDLVHITLPRDSPFYVMRGDGNGCTNTGATQSATSILGASRSQEDHLNEHRRRHRSGRSRHDTPVSRPRALSIDCKPSNKTYPAVKPHYVCENAARNRVCHEMDSIRRGQEKLEASQSKIFQLLKEIHRNQRQEKEEAREVMASMSKKLADEVNAKFKALFGDFVDVLGRFQGTLANYHSSWQKANEKTRMLDIRLEQASSNILSMNVSLDTLSSQMVAMEARLSATAQMLLESTNAFRHSHRYRGSPVPANARCGPCCQQYPQQKPHYMGLPPYPPGDDDSFWSYLDRSASSTSTEHGTLMLGGDNNNKMVLNKHKKKQHLDGLAPSNVDNHGDGGDPFLRPFSENVTMTAETTIPSGFLSRTESFEADREERLIDISAAGDYVKFMTSDKEMDCIEDKSGNVPGSIGSMSVIDSTDSTLTPATAVDMTKNAANFQKASSTGNGATIGCILPQSPLQNRQLSPSSSPPPKMPSYFRGTRRLANLQKVRNCRHSTDTEASMSSDLLMSDVISSLVTDTVDEGGTRSFDHSMEHSISKVTTEEYNGNNCQNRNTVEDRDCWETATPLSTTLTGTTDTCADRRLNDEGDEDTKRDCQPTGDQQKLQTRVLCGHVGDGQQQCDQRKKLMAPRQLLDCNSISETCASYSEDYDVNDCADEQMRHTQKQCEASSGFTARQSAGRSPFSDSVSISSSSSSDDMACIGSTVCDKDEGTEL